MTAPGALKHWTTMFVLGGVETFVSTLPEHERVVIYLGTDSNVAVHLDRDGLALLESVLDQARTDLDTAISERAAAVEADTEAARERERALFGHVENVA